MWKGYFWITARNPLGFTVNLHRINGIRSNMLVTMVTIQMAINSDLTSIKSWLLKNLLLAKTKTKKYNPHLYFYLLHKHKERRFLFSVFVFILWWRRWIFHVLRVYDWTLQRIIWLESYKQNNRISVPLLLLPCFGYVSNFPLFQPALTKTGLELDTAFWKTVYKIVSVTSKSNDLLGSDLGCMWGDWVSERIRLAFFSLSKARTDLNSCPILNSGSSYVSTGIHFPYSLQSLGVT